MAEGEWIANLFDSIGANSIPPMPLQAIDDFMHAR